MGRNTYESVCAFNEWPFGSKPVYVMTHRPLVPVHGERVVQGSMEDALCAVQASGVQSIYLDGGDVVRQALQSNQVDELVLSWVPVILGQGVRLFGEGVPSSRWRLAHSRVFRSGMVQACYHSTR